MRNEVDRFFRDTGILDLVVVDQVDDFLAHYGVKGMRWGVRKKYAAYQNKMYSASPGAEKTSVTTKTGEKISVVKEKPGPLSLAVAKLTGRKPEDTLSAMTIQDSSGKKVGSFQVWREGPSTVRGEWLEINKGSQGRGYSRAAIEGLLIAAKRDPALREVRLQVPADAAPAKHIYSQLGFTMDRELGDSAMFGVIEDWVLRV